jgi:hypothetical protein
VKNQTIITSLLKQQPRQGASPSPEDAQAAKALKEITDTIPIVSTLLNQYAAVQKSLMTSNNELSMGLGKLIGIQEDYAAGLLEVVKNIDYLGQRNSKLNKSFGLNSVSAQAFAKRLRLVSVNLGVGSDKVFEYAENLKDLTTGFIQSTKIQAGSFQTTLLTGQKYMLENLKITEQAAEGYEYYATSVADSGMEALVIQDKLAKSISAATGIDQLSIQKSLTEDIGNLTADMQVQYSRIPGSLELAVLKSRALGMSIEKLNAAGTNLLNIESSIGSELEYQLLSGKRLLTQDGKSLTNAYRMATIQGDANKQADLMNQFIKDQGPMLEKNLYARKKAAELMGTDEATLARSIQKQKLMTKLGAENLMNLSAEQMAPEIEKLRNKFKDDDEKQKQITELLKASDTRTTTQIFEQQSLVNQDRTIAAIEASGKIDVGKVGTETLAGMKKADAMINQFNGLAASFGKLSIFSETAAKLNKPLSNLAAAIPLFGETFSTAIDSLTNLIKLNFKTGAQTATPVSPNNDALVMNDGLIKFHPSDKFMQVNDSTMIAGTNVDGNKKLARAISGGGGSSIDYNKMATAIAMALQHVKVEAVVKTDTLFAATKMNGRRGI